MKRLLWGLVALVFLWLIFERFRMETMNTQLDKEFAPEEEIYKPAPSQGQPQQIPMHAGEAPAPGVTPVPSATQSR